MGQTWWHRTWRRVRYWMSHLPQSSLASFRSKEAVPLVEEDPVWESLSKLGVQRSMGPDGMHPHVMSMQDHSQLSSSDHGTWKRFLRAGGKQMSLTFSRRQEGGPRELQTGQPSLGSLEGNRKRGRCSRSCLNIWKHFFTVGWLSTGTD